VTVLLGPVAGLLIAAPNDTAGADDWFGAARTALGSYSGSISQPFRAGLTFGDGPPGLASTAILAVSFLPQLAVGKSAARGRPREGQLLTWGY
jgi:hypothetical protein